MAAQPLMTWLLGTKLGRGLSAAVMAILAIVTFGAMKKREGHKEGVESVRRRATAAAETRKEKRDEIDDDVADGDAIDSLRKSWTRD